VSRDELFVMVSLSGENWLMALSRVGVHHKFTLGNVLWQGPLPHMTLMLRKLSCFKICAYMSAENCDDRLHNKT
jgi:hypothetical protein